MFRFSLDMLISNLVDFSLCMMLNFGDKLRAQKKILSAVAGRWRVFFNICLCFPVLLFSTVLNKYKLLIFSLALDHFPLNTTVVKILHL